VPIVLKSGSLSLLETSWPVQARNGIAFLLPWREKLTQILVVRSHVKDRHLESALEFGSGEHLSDAVVVVDHHGGKGSKVQTQNRSLVFLSQFMEPDVYVFVVFLQNKPVAPPHGQARGP